MRACVRVLAVRAVESFDVVERGNNGETRDEELLRLRHEVKELRAFKAAVQQQQACHVEAFARGVAEGVPPCPLCGQISGEPRQAPRHRGQPRLLEQQEREKTPEKTPEPVARVMEEQVEQPADWDATDQVMKEDGLQSVIAQVAGQYAPPASPAIESVSVSTIRSPLVDEADAEFLAVRHTLK